MAKAKRYTAEQLRDAEKMAATLANVPEEKRTLVIMMTNSFMAGMEAQKAIDDTAKAAALTFDKFTKKGSLKDFKRHDNYYVAGPVGEFYEVPENGELKHDIFKDDKLPQRQLKTYGRQFTLSRKAFIDDDIGLVTSLPARYAAAARKTINKQVS